MKEPEAIRFAFNNGDEPNLFNREGLPASTFRTDDWDMITETAKIVSDFDPSSKKIIVKINSNEQHEIRYTLDGSDPDKSSSKYSEPLKIDKDSKIKARVYVDDTPSLLIAEAKIEKHSAVGKEVNYVD